MKFPTNGQIQNVPDWEFSWAGLPAQGLDANGNLVTYPGAAAGNFSAIPRNIQNWTRNFLQNNTPQAPWLNLTGFFGREVTRKKISYKTLGAEVIEFDRGSRAP